MLYLRSQTLFDEEIPSTTPATIGSITSSSGIEYYLQGNTTPTFPGSTTAYINPTDVMKKLPTGEESIFIINIIYSICISMLIINCT